MDSEHSESPSRMIPRTLAVTLKLEVVLKRIMMPLVAVFRGTDSESESDDPILVVLVVLCTVVIQMPT